MFVCSHGRILPIGRALRMGGALAPVALRSPPKAEVDTGEMEQGK